MEDDGRWKMMGGGIGEVGEGRRDMSQGWELGSQPSLPQQAVVGGSRAEQGQAGQHSP